MSERRRNFSLWLMGIVYLALWGASAPEASAERIYAFVPDLLIRASPEAHSVILARMVPHRWTPATSRHGQWLNIVRNDNRQGYVHSAYTTRRWIKIWKKERQLTLLDDETPLKTYSIGLGGDPLADKVQQGDSRTPIGKFYITEMLKNPQPASRYGARSLRLSYPSREDARRGLGTKLISTAQYNGMIRSLHQCQTPLQDTALGGSIRIHGGGSQTDWTLGCIALADPDIIELYDLLPPKGTLVEIYPDRAADERLNRHNAINLEILSAAKALMKTNMTYTEEAQAIIPIGYPQGDFRQDIGVCTDLVIRALRQAGIDLQALLYEDILLNPRRYPNIQTSNPNIDHRRTRNLKIWFDHHAQSLSHTPPGRQPHDWQPGDIVIMDTGIRNGTPFDHIGIVSDTLAQGRPQVINLWTIGHKVTEMDLLDGVYPKIMGHYRLLRAMDYDN